MKHNYLITGGAGFIGSHFVQYLSNHVELEQKIVVLDELTYAGDLSRLAGLLQDRVTFIKGDICHQEKVEEILKNHDISCVVNFAAESHVDRSIAGEEAFLKTNVQGVQTLLNTTRSYWESPAYKESALAGLEPLYVQISTDEVYGGAPLDTDEMRDEATPLKPTNPYAATKAAADLLIGAFQHTYAYPAIIIRSTNNYGPNQHEEKLIPKVIDCLRSNKPIPIYGQGQQKRTWLHVEDNCRGILTVVEKGRLGEIYNIVGQETLTNKELVEQLMQTYNRLADRPYNGKIIYVEDRPGHDPFYAVSGKKLERQLNFKPRISLALGLEKLMEK